MIYILYKVKIRPDVPGSGALYRLSRNSTGLRGLRLQCHSTAVELGSGVRLLFSICVQYEAVSSNSDALMTLEL